MRPKVVALIAASSVSVGWLLASVIVPPVAELQVLPERAERRRPQTSEQTTATYTEQLNLKLQQAPKAPVTRRNPFVFGGRLSAPAIEPAASAPRDRGVEAREPEIPVSPVVTGPSLRLSGVGETAGVRTAVISDGTTVHLVKIGETVNGYAVVEISESAVIVADASGAQWTLRMR